MSLTQDLTNSLHTGFIDGNTVSLEEYQPRLLINDHKRGRKVLTCLINELQSCDEFFFSVAFVTNGGIATMINTLKELDDKDIRGKIIASQYQNFTQPEALRRLIKFKNIELKIVTEGNFHAKGYIFKKKNETYSLIVGSSNLTQDALCMNKEWNIKLSTSDSGNLITSTLQEFEQTFHNATKVNKAWINSYEKIYVNYWQKNKGAYEINDISVDKNGAKVFNIKTINPNKMQVDASKALQKLRNEGKNKAILISATGTGKTFLSAFDAIIFNPKRLLFVIHRENIARAAMKSYQSIFRGTKTMGILSGHDKAENADFVFATIQTISKDNTLCEFPKDYFDYIIIDEVHRSGAQSYQKIIDYFTPKFLLGMTATPERTDGYDIYKTFDYNIAYEIRLNRALEENMLVPFHYYGVSDIEVDGILLDDIADFNKLVCNERVDKIKYYAEFYGCDNGRVKGLVFCSRNEEARELSNEFNKLGCRTITLDGESSMDLRENSINRLEQDSVYGALDYIFTVDIFNEGVDIPKINQIIMLRPTQSAIIFVQQLGRGLRKSEDKEYLTVIDFIGNYQKNFLIPIALSDDRSYNKDTIRKFMSEVNRVIPGCSTINFDEISKKKIYASIDTAKFNNVRLFKESYKNLKMKLGRIPTLKDFGNHGSIDVIRIFENSSLGSYYKFLVNYENEYKIRLNGTQEKFIEFISKKFANGKRPHELELLKIIIINKHHIMNLLSKVMKEKYDIEISKKTVVNLVNMMTNNFTLGAGRETYKECIFIQKEKDDYCISEKLLELLSSKNFYDMVIELIDFGIARNEIYYKERYSGTSFKLYQKYTYDDVCRLLEWEKGEVALNIGGYKFDKNTNTYPVFINYDKSAEINAAIAFEDRFVTPSLLIALSKSGRKPDSEDVVTAYRAKELGIDMELFVRKNKDDNISKEFYYLGKISAIGEPNPIVMNGTNRTAVEIKYQLDTPIQEDIYEYLTN